MTSKSREIVTQQQEAATAASLYGARENLEEFYRAIKTVAPWVRSKKYEMSPEEVMLVARRATAMGLDPLNPHEVQIWKDWQGVQFQLAYSLQREWVRHFKGKFHEPQFKRLTEPELKEEGLDPENDIAYHVRILMEDDVEKMQQLIKAGYKPEEARRWLEITGVGVATKEEWENEYFAPKGRSKAWKVKKRAVTDALRGKFGTPTRPEIVELRRLRGDANLTLEDWKVAAEQSDLLPEEQLETARLAAQNRTWEDEWNELSDEEKREHMESNIELLRGSEEDREGFEEGDGEEEPDPASPEQESEVVEGEYNEVDDYSLIKDDHPEVYEAAHYETDQGRILGRVTKKELNQMLDYFLNLESPKERAIEMQQHVETLLEFLKDKKGNISVFDEMDPWKPPEVSPLDAETIRTEIREAAGWTNTEEGWIRPDGELVEGVKMQITASIAGDTVGGDDKMRHNLWDILFGESTTKRLLDEEAQVIRDRWQCEESWKSNKQGKTEAHVLLDAHGLFSGEVFGDTL